MEFIYSSSTFLYSVLGAVIVLAGLYRLCLWRADEWPESAMVMARRQAHRGYRVTPKVIENTLAAFREAKNAGANMIECDVQLARDGVVVIFHDRTLQRLIQRSDRVVDMASGELAELAGAPRLIDVIRDTTCPSLINIELKQGDSAPGALEMAVVKAVLEAQAEGRVLFSSFSVLILKRLAELAPKIPRGLLVEPRYYRRVMLIAWLAHPHLLHPHESLVTEKRMKSWRKRDLRIATWTVNDPERIRELERLGVDSIITDTHLVSKS